MGSSPTSGVARWGASAVIALAIAAAVGSALALWLPQHAAEVDRGDVAGASMR